MSAIEGAWARIESWLTAKSPPTAKALRPGATKAALEALEKGLGRALPADVRASLARHDGQKTERHLLGPYTLLSTGDVVDAQRSWVEAGAKAEWVPLGSDGAGNLLYVDAASGAVRDFDVESWSHKTLGTSLATWLEALAVALEERGAWDRTDGMVGVEALFDGPPWAPTA